MADLPEVAKLERQRARQLALERRNLPRWHWLSFACCDGFLGAAIVWAYGIETAVLRAHKLNISRAFSGEVEVFCQAIPRRDMKERVPSNLRNRLLSAQEVRYKLDGRWDL